eukprot:1411809-Rhodomonas_salina.1
MSTAARPALRGRHLTRGQVRFPIVPVTWAGLDLQVVRAQPVGQGRTRILLPWDLAPTASQERSRTRPGQSRLLSASSAARASMLRAGAPQNAPRARKGFTLRLWDRAHPATACPALGTRLQSQAAPA